MSVAFRTSALVSYSGTAQAKSITVPTDTAAGDLVVISVATGASGMPATPSGWTLAASNTDVVEAAVFYRVAQAGDAGSVVTFTQTTNTRAILVATVYSGVDNAAPINHTSTAVEATSQTTHAGPSVTTTATSWMHRSLFLKDSTTTSTAVTAPSGFTMRQSQPGSGFTSTGQISLSVADTAGDVAAGSQTGTWTVDQASDNAVAIALEIVPATSTVTTRPVSDVTTAGTSFVGGASAFAVTADDDPSTYVEIASGASTTLEVKLGTMTAAPDTVTVKYLGAGSPATMSVNTRLYQGATLIADLGTETAVVSTETTKTYTLTSPQKAACTVLSDLRVRMICSAT